MRKRLAAILAAGVLVVAACGDDSDDSPTTTGADTTDTTAAAQGAETFDIQVDVSSADTNMAFTSYFPNELTVHPGDTLAFNEVFTGEPHTVTLGTIVDEGAAALDPEAEEEPEAWGQIPALLPEGPGDAVQAAAQPCFLATGAPPAEEACGEDDQTQTPFDGTQTYYNSGFLEDGDVFSVELADDIEPGDYTFFCNLHRAAMMGTVTVVAADETADTPEEVAERGQEQIDDAIAELEPVLTAVRAGSLPPFVEAASPGGVIVGGFGESPAGLVIAFGPENIDIAAGESVTWTIAGPHTVTFGASEAQRTLIAKAPDGSVHLNPDAAAPAGGPGAPEGPPPETPGPPIVIDGGAYNGALHSSGIVLSFPPQLFAYKLSFPTAGSYNYFCTIHPDMTGTVNVT